jgi:hypothetical protein
LKVINGREEETNTSARDRSEMILDIVAAMLCADDFVTLLAVGSKLGMQGVDERIVAVIRRVHNPGSICVSEAETVRRVEYGADNSATQYGGIGRPVERKIHSPAHSANALVRAEHMCNLDPHT